MNETREHEGEGSLVGTLRETLETFTPDDSLPFPAQAQLAVHIAGLIQTRSTALQTPQERKQQRELERMIQSPHDKATMIQMTDQAFRSGRASRAVDQLTHILDVQGVPRYFSRLDQTLLRGFQSFGALLPGVAVPLVKEKMRAETANVILPAEDEVLNGHLKARREAGLRMNVNLLGEALLGEGEAQRRLEVYLAALQNPEIESISVKVSTIFSQISSLAFEHTVSILCDRLELLYREARRMEYRRANGAVVSKFVYLDMEEYRDLRVTTEAFMRTLDRVGLEQAQAGIALQAYIPDSYPAQQRINAWARNRVATGGAPVTIRIVKGANMESEKVEASIRSWPQAPYKEKRSTDANYRRMLHEALLPENITAVRVGVASHNLFELSYALVLAAQNDCLDRLQFEMLEGMANHTRRALCELSDNFLLYAPATRKENFVNAIGYLVRRLDENTGPDNFLRHAFKLEPGDDEWLRLRGHFYDSFEAMATTPYTPRRTQDRRIPLPPSADDEGPFTNEADTDFSLPQNVEWAEAILDRWRTRHGDSAARVPVLVGGVEIFDARDVCESLDPSRRGVVVGRYSVASAEDVVRAVELARQDPAGWRLMLARQRSTLLGNAAHEIRKARGELMGVALAEGGKTFLQSDPEVSEAIDFCNFYRRSAVELSSIQGVEAQGRGVVVVTSPWNFPIAIPCGGIAAALAAGNTVILKPAPETVLTAWLLCQCFWRAGIPRQALQFMPCHPDNVIAQQLACHNDVDVVILTGSTATAVRLLNARPGIDLIAETGGKNATVVSAVSDRDLAISHIVQSAFGHSGQKCSATSLLVLEEEVFSDERFKRALCDAVQSLPVGSAWQVHNVMGPLIRPPNETLERGLKELEMGESWAVMPHRLEDNPCLYSPGVKWNVRPGSFTHMTELFGPVLGVMKAKDLGEAIDLVNQTGYGLTAGLESLDEREQKLWRSSIRAGNLYINRVTTGAVVLRQPFGGVGKSAFGSGIKAGGPNYVTQLMTFRQNGHPGGADTIGDPLLGELCAALVKDKTLMSQIPAEDGTMIVRSICSYELAFAGEFGSEHDHFRLIGQDNLRRYVPVRELRIRLNPADTPFELFARVCAARVVGCRVTVSHPHGFDSPALAALELATESWGGRIEFVEESDSELAAVIRQGFTDRVRYAAQERVPDVVLKTIADCGIYIASAPVMAEGKIELLWYLREQNISVDYHRYGTLGHRAAESRSPTE